MNLRLSIVLLTAKHSSKIYSKSIIKRKWDRRSISNQLGLEYQRKKDAAKKSRYLLMAPCVGKSKVNGELFIMKVIFHNGINIFQTLTYPSKLSVAL